MKPYPALCKDCKHSEPEEGYEWNLLCKHPVVNANDAEALSSPTARGTGCKREREKGIFKKCGMAGDLWEPKK